MGVHGHTLAGIHSNVSHTHIVAVVMTFTIYIWVEISWAGYKWLKCHCWHDHKSINHLQRCHFTVCGRYCEEFESLSGHCCSWKGFLCSYTSIQFFFKLTFKYIFTFFAVHKQQGKPSKWTWLLVEFMINVITAVLYFMGVYGCVVLFDFCFVYVYYMLKFNDNNNLKNYSMIILQ